MLKQFANESALSVSLDVLRLPGSEQWTHYLALGSNSRVILFERSSQESPFMQVESLEGVTDNVSCLKTVYIAEKKQIVTLYATFDGKLTCRVVKQLQ